VRAAGPDSRLAVVAALLAAVYPFCKRVTHLPQLVLGAAFGMSIPMAFAATSGSVPAVGWALFAISLVWSTAYDTEYAMTDRDDDLKIGIKSTAILFGRFDVLAVALLLAAVLVGLIGVGLHLHYGVAWWLGLVGSLPLAGSALQKAYWAEVEPDHPTQVVVFGPTQSGKSTAVNLLLGHTAAGVSPLAGHTVHAQAFLQGHSDADALEPFFEGYTRTTPDALPGDALDYWSVAVNKVDEASREVVIDALLARLAEHPISGPGSMPKTAHPTSRSRRSAMPSTTR